MRFRSLLAATGTVALSLSTLFVVGGQAANATPARHSAPALPSRATPNSPTVTPQIYDVQIQQVAKSTLDVNGGRPVLIVPLSFSHGICSYDYQEYDAYFNEWTDLGTDTANTATDFIPYYELDYGREYAVSATSCTGQTSSYSYSSYFYPESYNSNSWLTFTGSHTTVHNAKAYASDIQQLTGLHSQATWNTNYDFNFGIYGETGPQGGTATVYVDGAKAGTINFYSSTLKNFKTLLFKDGNESGENFNIRIQMTSAGAGHGTTMYLDALSENQD